MRSLARPLTIVGALLCAVPLLLAPSHAVLGGTGLVVLGIGGLVALIGAQVERIRILAAGTVIMVLGSSLTGLDLGFAAAWAGAAGVLVAISALTLALAGADRPVTLVMTLPTGLLVGFIGVGIAWILASGVGGGADARAGIGAWIAIVGAVGWMLVHYARAQGAPAPRTDSTTQLVQPTGPERE